MLSLLPIFIAFVITHVWLITYALIERASIIPREVHSAFVQTGSSIHSMGFFALALMFLRAYSLGGGTYTGIEAVSNGLPICASRAP